MTARPVAPNKIRDMSWRGTKSPNKPTKKPRFEIKKDKYGKYILDEKVEAEFRKVFPKRLNIEVMEYFGISFSAMQRIKRLWGLEKDKASVKRRTIKKIVRTCTENGYYESLKGKRPCDEAMRKTKEMREAGFNPIGRLKETDPKRYKKFCKKISERVRAEIATDKKRMSWGLPQKTNRDLVVDPYTKSQTWRRSNAKKKGYILGDASENSGERYTIYYDEATERDEILERGLCKIGFTVKSKIQKPLWIGRERAHTRRRKRPAETTGACTNTTETA